MTYTKMTAADWKYSEIKPRESGDLVVSHAPNHIMHWEEYGNPDGEPIIFIHGGPGGGTNAEQARFFDPKRYRIILYDQRGCGKSKPHVTENLAAGMSGNITANLVEDIEALRKDRAITGKAHVFGGSWGSTLAMAYAQAHQDHVENLILRGIFLCDQTDLGYFYQGNAANLNDTSTPGAYRAYSGQGEYTIPQALRDPKMAEAYRHAWQDYVNIIPENQRGDMIGAYHALLNSPDVPQEKKVQAALAWSVWEGVTSYLNHDVSDLGKFKDPKFAVAFATIENEYFYRALRGQDAALTGLMKPENLRKMASIPIYIAQGKHDQVCVAVSARKLKAALEELSPVKLEYQETIAGHAMKEIPTNKALVDILDGLPPMQELPKRGGQNTSARPKTGHNLG